MNAYTDADTYHLDLPLVLRDNFSKDHGNLDSLTEKGNLESLHYNSFFLALIIRCISFVVCSLQIKLILLGLLENIEYDNMRPTVVVEDQSC